MPRLRKLAGACTIASTRAAGVLKGNQKAVSRRSADQAGASSVVDGGEMLGEGGEQDIPPLVTAAGRLVDRQRWALVGRFVPILLQELRDEPPPVPIVAGRGEMTSKVGQGHRPVGDRS
jgi:hypothetical protein